MRWWTRLIIAVLLIPLCLGASQALFWVLQESGRTTADPPRLSDAPSRESPSAAPRPPASSGQGARELDGVAPRPAHTWVPLLAGAACWLVIYIMLPRPMWVYVFGHELTHAIAAWIFESKVKRFRVTAQGGHVLLSDVNFIITLAPYFVPLYALFLAFLYGLAQWLFDCEPYRIGFLLLLGAAYAFHLTLTGHALQTEQTDITRQGWFFSIVIIWLGNLAVLIPGLATLLNVSLSATFRELALATWGVWRLLGKLVGLA
jgi:hypothetical protein